MQPARDNEQELVGSLQNKREEAALHHDLQTASLSRSKVTQGISARSVQRVNILPNDGDGMEVTG